MKSFTALSFALFLPLFFSACSEDGDFNVFSTQQDLELGRQTDQQIRNEPQEFPILGPQEYPQAYVYLQGMVDEIVTKGEVPYADLFPYEVAIINKDVENAFATPGGFLYVYTGLVHKLETGDQLAGVMAHEIAHSAEHMGSYRSSRRIENQIWKSGWGSVSKREFTMAY